MVMQHILKGYSGLNLLFRLNWDRLIYLATIVVALMIGSFIGSIL